MTNYQPAPPPVPQSAPTGAKPARGGTVALVLGIVAIVAALIPVLSYIAWAVGIAAIIVGIIALAKGTAKRGGAITGVVLGVLSFILSIVMSILYTTLIFVAAVSTSLASLPVASTLPSNDSSELPSPSSLPQTAPASGQRSVVYTVKGSGKATSITYLVASADGSGENQVKNVKLPWKKTIGIKDPTAFSTTVFSLVVQAGADGGKVTCEIEADGKVISKHSASGQYTVAACSGTAG